MNSHVRELQQRFLAELTDQADPAALAVEEINGTSIANSLV
jgi:hypothetical protein